MKRKTCLVVVSILTLILLSGCQPNEVPDNTTSIFMDRLGTIFGIIIALVIVNGPMFGIPTYKVMIDKGYDNHTANKWGIAATFFGIGPLIAACGKTNLTILNAINNLSLNSCTNASMSQGTASSVPTVICSECGAPNPIGTSHCSECGADLLK